MPIRFRCFCDASLRVSNGYAGRDVRCPRCGAVARVPAAVPRDVERELHWTRVSHTGSWGYLSALGGVLFLLGCLPLTLAGYVMWKSWRASSWPTTVGIVTGFRTVTEKTSHTTMTRSGSRRTHTGTSRSASIRYRYEVGGAPYGGRNMYSIPGLTTDWPDTPEGTQIEVHYNPANPSEACLEPWATGLAGALALVGLVLTLMGGTLWRWE